MYRQAEIVFSGGFVYINGICFHKYPFKNKTEIFKVVKEYLDGMPCKQIHRIYKVSNIKLKKIRSALGIQVKHGGSALRGKKMIERKRLSRNVLNGLKKGMSTLEISKKYKCQHITVKHIQYMKKVKGRPDSFYD